MMEWILEQTLSICLEEAPILLIGFLLLLQNKFVVIKFLSLLSVIKNIAIKFDVKACVNHLLEAIDNQNYIRFLIDFKDFSFLIGALNNHGIPSALL